MNNARKFLASFNNIESELRHRNNFDNSVGFRKIIYEIADKNKIVSMNRKLLESYTELRNAIVHTEGEEFIIAEPHDDVVNKIKEVEELILNPPKVLPKYQIDVLILTPEDSVFTAINLMFQNDFSQVPIYKEGGFIGLLSSNTITRWLGAVDREIDPDGSTIITDTRISDVLQYTENKDNYRFINRNYYQHQVLDIFEKEKNIDAVLITHSGKQNEKLLGIITVWDLIEINKVLNS